MAIGYVEWDLDYYSCAYSQQIYECNNNFHNHGNNTAKFLTIWNLINLRCFRHETDNKSFHALKSWIFPKFFFNLKIFFMKLYQITELQSIICLKHKIFIMSIFILFFFLLKLPLVISLIVQTCCYNIIFVGKIYYRSMLITWLP